MRIYVVIDLEMCRVQHKTSVYPYRNEIIQIGAVMMDESYEILDQYSTYVKPRYGNISRFIFTLTGITDGAIKEAPDIQEALLQLIRWIGNNDVVFYSWSGTDYAQICKEIQLKCQDDTRLNMLLDKAKWIDYQEIMGKRLKTDQPIKLTEALELAELDTEGRLHDGLADAYNTARLIAKLESNENYKTLIERVRENEKDQKPLAVSLGNFLNGFTLELA